MSKFLVINQDMRTNTYVGPSGIRYESRLGQAFIVNNNEDVAYFSKFPKRFKKVLFNPKAKPVKDVDVILRERLQQIERVTESTIDMMVDYYLTWDNVQKVVVRGGELDNRIPEDEKALIVNAVIDENNIPQDKEPVKKAKKKAKKKVK